MGNCAALGTVESSARLHLTLSLQLTQRVDHSPTWYSHHRTGDIAETQRGKVSFTKPQQRDSLCFSSSPLLPASHPPSLQASTTQFLSGSSLPGMTNSGRADGTEHLLPTSTSVPLPSPQEGGKQTHSTCRRERGRRSQVRRLQHRVCISRPENIPWESPSSSAFSSVSCALAQMPSSLC